MDAQAEAWIIPEMLKRARERVGLSPEQAEKIAKKLKGFKPVTAEQIRAWETGKGTPEYAHLETLTEVYVCPIHWFFASQPSRRFDIAQHISCRGLRSDWRSLSPETRRALAWFVEMAEWISSLIQEHGIKWIVKVSTTVPPQMPPEVVARLAKQERQRLGFVPEETRNMWLEQTQEKLKSGSRTRPENEAFLWWREVVEEQGVFCFQKRIKSDEMRGAVFWSGNIPFILVNSDDAEAATGRLFTLLHEYGHIIMDNAKEGIACDFQGKGKGHRTEWQVNLFAARLLLTPEELKERLRELNLFQFRERWGDKTLDKIREPFCVSRDVVAIMIEQIGLAPTGFYKQKREQWSRRKPFGRGRGGGKKLVERKFHEIGFSSTRLLLRLMQQEAVSLPALSNALEMSIPRVQEFLTYARKFGDAG